MRAGPESDEEAREPDHRARRLTLGRCLLGIALASPGLLALRWVVDLERTVRAATLPAFRPNGSRLTMGQIVFTSAEPGCSIPIIGPDRSIMLEGGVRCRVRGESTADDDRLRSGRLVAVEVIEGPWAGERFRTPRSSLFPVSTP